MYDRLYDRLILLGNTRILKVVLDPLYLIWLNKDINKKHKSWIVFVNSI